MGGEAWGVVLSAFVLISAASDTEAVWLGTRPIEPLPTLRTAVHQLSKDKPWIPLREGSNWILHCKNAPFPLEEFEFCGLEMAE